MCLLYENAICSLGSSLMKKLFQVQQPDFLRSYLVSALSSVIRRTPSLFSFPALYLQCLPQPLHLLTILDSSAAAGIFPWSLITIWSKRSVVQWPVWCCLACSGDWAENEQLSSEQLSANREFGLVSSAVQQLWWNLVVPTLCETYLEPQHLSETGLWAGWFWSREERGLRKARSWVSGWPKAGALPVVLFSCSHDHSLLQCFLIAF